MADPAFTVLSLCAGVGGLDLGVRIAAPSARTVGYVEIEAYAAAILAARAADGWLDEAPIWLGDLRELDPAPFVGQVDCIIGGYPCQPFSHAGKRQGADDPRHLWPRIAELVAAIKPGRCFFENVAGHLSLGFDRVGADLQAMGYRVAAGIFSAAEVGASHRRERLFIMADADGRHPGAERQQRGGEQRLLQESNGDGTTVADARHAGSPRAGRRPQPGGAVLIPGNGGGEEGTAVEHPEGVGRREGRPEHELRIWRDTAADDGGTVAHPGGNGSTAGLAGPHEGKEGITGIPDDGGPEAPPLFAPGPSDPIWPDILARAPHLEPAVRRMAHGLADQLDPGRPLLTFRVPTPAEYVASALRWRIDRLRACGNGVVPLAAAFAWQTLESRLAEDRAGRSGHSVLNNLPDHNITWEKLQ